MSGKLVENIGGGLVVVQTDKRTAAEIAQQEYTAPGPARVVVGTGGKLLRWPDGHETGPIGGEALRNALKLGAVVIGEEPQTNEAAAGLDAYHAATPRHF